MTENQLKSKKTSLKLNNEFEIYQDIYDIKDIIVLIDD